MRSPPLTELHTFHFRPVVPSQSWTFSATDVPAWHFSCIGMAAAQPDVSSTRLTRLLASADSPSWATDWIVNSGASHHMAGNLDALLDVHVTDPVHITVASGRTTVAKMGAKATLSLSTHTRDMPLTRQDVILAPGLAFNLL